MPLYGLLLLGGTVSVDHVKGGLTVGTKESWIRLKAWPRIGILVNQLRYVAASVTKRGIDERTTCSRLLNAQLEKCIEDGTALSDSSNPVLNAMLALLTRDGMT